MSFLATKGSRVLEKKVNETQVSKTVFSQKKQTKLWCRIHLTWGRLKTCSKDSAAEWNDSHYKTRRLSSLSQRKKSKRKLLKHLNTPMIWWDERTRLQNSFMMRKLKLNRKRMNTRWRASNLRWRKKRFMLNYWILHLVFHWKPPRVAVVLGQFSSVCWQKFQHKRRG